MYRTTDHLGSGQYGTVNRGVWQSPNGPVDVAVKTLKSGSDQDDKVKFLQEAAIMGQFKHHNIVKLFGVVLLKEPVFAIYIIHLMFLQLNLFPAENDSVGVAIQGRPEESPCYTEA